MEILLAGIVIAAGAALFMLIGAYFGQMAVQNQQPEPVRQQPEPPMTEEEQRELAERLSRAAEELFGGIAESFGSQFGDFSQVFVARWPEAAEPQQKKDEES